MENTTARLFLLGMLNRRSPNEPSGLEALFLYCLRGILEDHFTYGGAYQPNTSEKNSSGLKDTPTDSAAQNMSTSLPSAVLFDDGTSAAPVLSPMARLLWNTVMTTVLGGTQTPEVGRRPSPQATPPAGASTSSTPTTAQPRRTLKLSGARGGAGSATLNVDANSSSDSSSMLALARCWALLNAVSDALVASRFDFHSEEYDGLWVRLRRAVEMRLSSTGIRLLVVSERGAFISEANGAAHPSPFLRYLVNHISFCGSSSDQQMTANNDNNQTLMQRYILEFLTFSFADLSTRAAAAVNTGEGNESQIISTAMSRHLVLQTIDRLWAADIRPPLSPDIESSIAKDSGIDYGGTGGMFLLPVSDAIASGYSSKITNPMSIAFLYDRARGGYTVNAYAGRANNQLQDEIVNNSALVSGGTMESESNNKKVVEALAVFLHTKLHHLAKVSTTARVSHSVEIASLPELYEDLTTMARNAQAYNGANSWLAGCARQLGLSWAFDRVFKKSAENLQATLTSTPLQPPAKGSTSNVAGQVATKFSISGDAFICAVVDWLLTPYILSHGPFIGSQTNLSQTAFLYDCATHWSRYEREPLTFSILRFGHGKVQQSPTELSEAMLRPSLLPAPSAPMFVYSVDFAEDGNSVEYRLSNRGILKTGASLQTTTTKGNDRKRARAEKPATSDDFSTTTATTNDKKGLTQLSAPPAPRIPRTRGAAAAAAALSEASTKPEAPASNSTTKDATNVAVESTPQTKKQRERENKKAVKDEGSISLLPSPSNQSAQPLETTANWAQCDACDTWRLTPYELTDPKYAFCIKKRNKKGEASWTCDCTPGRSCKDKADEKLPKQAQRELIIQMRATLATQTKPPPEALAVKVETQKRTSSKRTRERQPSPATSPSSTSSSSSSSTTSSSSSESNGRNKNRGGKGSKNSKKVGVVKNLEGLLDSEDEDLLVSAFTEGGGPTRKKGRRKEPTTSHSKGGKESRPSTKKSSRTSRQSIVPQFGGEGDDNTSLPTTNSSSQPFGLGAAGSAFDSLLFHNLEDENPIDANNNKNGKVAPPASADTAVGVGGTGAMNSSGSRRLALSALRKKEATIPAALSSAQPETTKPPPATEVPPLPLPTPLSGPNSMNPTSVQAPAIRTSSSVAKKVIPVIPTLPSKTTDVQNAKHSKRTEGVEKQQQLAPPAVTGKLVPKAIYDKVDRELAKIEAQLGITSSRPKSSNNALYGSPSIGPARMHHSTAPRPIPHVYLHFKVPPPLLLKAGGTLALFKAAAGSSNEPIDASLLPLLSHLTQATLDHNTALLWDRDNHKVPMRRPGSAYFWFLHEDLKSNGEISSAASNTSGKTCPPVPPPITLTPPQVQEMISAHRTILRTVHQCRVDLGLD